MTTLALSDTEVSFGVCNPAVFNGAKAMKILELALVMAVAAALAIWRGLAIFKYTFKKKNL